MQRNNTPVLLITVVLGVLALGATFFLMTRGSGTATPPPTAAVPTPTPAARWVAISDIPPRTRVNSTMLRREAQSGPVPADAITSLDDIRGVITRERIGRGETVLRTSFNPTLRRQVAANFEIPSGFRAVAIWVDPDQTAAGLVDIGDRVDVIANHKLTYEKGARQLVVGAQSFTAARTIGQNLLVLGVDKSIKAPEPTPTPVPGAAAPPPPPPTPVPAPGAIARTRILLAAPPEIASRLVAAADQGTLHVTIRNPSDGDQGAIPETREYPSRIYTQAPEKAAATLTNNLSKSYDKLTERIGNSFEKSMGTDSSVPPLTVPQPTSGGPTDETTLAPAEKEITVVRGTEKTRVLVPRR
jgi:Flp pilus assembly protein CpaB